ncbi:hypothetical protein A5637_13255 [Mycolicibacterium fortuitum]|uniref:hypothetical protein n=1 Tax=Mycolicibacterium fortuitum TaxID=1766 RepID=UPI0007ED39A9|nr:hypothetical protein [Mycolicibacterium fortuitum]OBK04043.1 hypothetical protein A5637_13255 [Mycolicibacterium fortuitum]
MSNPDDRWANPCKFGWTEYDGSRWCGEHGGVVEAESEPRHVCSAVREYRAALTKETPDA